MYFIIGWDKESELLGVAVFVSLSLSYTHKHLPFSLSTFTS